MAVNAESGMRVLWGFTRPHRGRLLLAAFLGLLGTTMMLTTPLVTKALLDSLESGDAIAGIASTLLVVLAVGLAASFAQIVLLGRLSEKIVYDARVNLVSRFIRAKLGQVQKFRSGELVTRVTSDTVLLRDAATSSLIDLVNGAVGLVATIVLMGLLDWKLLAVILLAVATLGVIFGLVVPEVGKSDREAQAAIGDLGGVLERTLAALRTVKASQLEVAQIGKITDDVRRAEQHSVRAVWYSALSWAVASGGVQIAIVVTLAVGAGRIALGTLSVSTLVALLLYAFNLVEPVVGLTGAIVSLQAGLAAAARIQETSHLAQEDPTLDAGTTASDRADSGPIMALRGVSVTYEGSSYAALSNVSLEIPRVGHVAIVGPSGAGKSTVLSLMLRFIDADSGELEFAGVPFSELSLGEVRSRMAYVEQDAPVLPGTIRENVLLRTEFMQTKPELQEDGARATELVWRALSDVQLDERVRGLPDGIDTLVIQSELSGGERQRLALARAIAGSADLLLLDEATAQLDGATEQEIQRAIARTARTAAVVTVAHRLSTVAHADKIYLLAHGTVRASGTHRELLASDSLYRELVAALQVPAGLDDADGPVGAAGPGQ